MPTKGRLKGQGSRGQLLSKQTLTEKEEKFLAVHEGLNKKIWLIIIVVFFLMGILSFRLGILWKEKDPVASRDHFWMAAIWLIYAIFVGKLVWENSKFIEIIRKLKK